MKTHLLIYELAAPDGQDVAFYKFIRRMAEQRPGRFETIQYIDPSNLNRIRQLHDEQGVDAVSKMLSDFTGISRCDELLVCSNWQFGNKVLMNCFPQAHKICYGDSIGLHIPEGYFADKSWKTTIRQATPARQVLNIAREIELNLRNRKRRPFLRSFSTLSFDIGYYLTLELASTKPAWNTRKASIEDLKRTFNEYTAGIKIPEAIAGAGKANVTVLMTSNFSESRKMTLENEIEAYAEFVSKNGGASDLILVKPHPRDSVEKLEILRDTMERIHPTAVMGSLDDYFVPFELVLIRILGDFPDFLERTTFVTFSSACVSLRFLFAVEPLIGFGPALVNRYFNGSAKASRLAHERDLNRLLQIKFDKIGLL